MSEALVQRLGMYKLRADIEIAAAGTEAEPELLRAALGDLPGVQDEGTLALALIRAGRVVVGQANSEKYTPHMLSLDLAGAVSFDKGCYTGQEVVARTEHLGKSRRRLARFRTTSTDVAIGDELMEGDSVAGTVVNADDGECLAVLPVERRDAPLRVRGADAVVAALPWD